MSSESKYFILLILILILAFILFTSFKYLKLRCKYSKIINYCKVFGYSSVDNNIFNIYKKRLFYHKEVNKYDILQKMVKCGYPDVYIPEDVKIYECIAIVETPIYEALETIGKHRMIIKTSNIPIGEKPKYYEDSLFYFYTTRLYKGRIYYSENYVNYVDNNGYEHKLASSKTLSKFDIKSDNIANVIQNAIGDMTSGAIYDLKNRIDTKYKYEKPYGGHKIANIANIPNNEIWYTITDKYAEIHIEHAIKQNLISNKYENGKGILKFDSEVTCITDTCSSVFLYNIECVVLPNSITSIGKRAFGSSDTIAEIILPNNLEIIGSGACSSLKRLRSIKVPDSVQILDEWAFSSCINLEDIKLSNSLKSIGDRAFYGCYSLTKIVIPESIEEIGEGAFDECSNLKEVYCKAVIPPKVKWRSGSNHDLFKNNSSGRKIYVPYESVDAYKKAPLWKIYAKDIVGFDYE